MKYLKYLFQSGNEHSIHSPFVFEFYMNVIKDQTPFYAFNQIEKLRAELLATREKIEVLDLGAGMKQGSGSRHSIKKIAQSSSVNAKFGQLLFRMVNFSEIETILEIGTSLGVSTAYMASPDKKAKMITMEGSPEKVRIAQKNFEQLDLPNIEVIEGSFDDQLPTVLKNYPKLDFVFIDGNHRKDPTIKYFDLIANNCHNDTIVVLDDIHWSDEMDDAWNQIIKRSDVTVSLDLFYFGIIFFKKELTKQNFTLRF
ncbi:MAG: class I SAM-dependent methyltransferase [Flavobacteriales bacterium]|nr:class I SAM-dependent methyltransferase [Flavobacteriales bacterium]